MTQMVEVTLHIPHERVLNEGFADVMRNASLRPDGTVVLDHETFGPGIERGDRVGVWKLIEH